MFRLCSFYLEQTIVKVMVPLSRLIFYTGTEIFFRLLLQFRGVYMKFFPLFLLATALFFSQPSAAFYHGAGQGIGKTVTPHKNSQKIDTISAQQAAQIAKNCFGGKVLKVRKKNTHAASFYRVKLVKRNGQVISVSVDAKTGQIRGN